MTDSKIIPRIGDVVLVEDKVGVVRYVGPLQTDKNIHFGVEIKGQPKEPGYDGMIGNVRYFQATNGRGIFTKRIDRIISSEELLEKVASLYEVIKHGQRNENASNKDSNPLGNKLQSPSENRYFVDKSRFDELIRERDALQEAYGNSMEKCESLQLQNQMLRGQANNKSETINQLQDKVNSWANRFGMRRPTLSSLDDTTINEIHSLVQSKELPNGRGDSGKRDRPSRTINEQDLPKTREARSTMMMDGNEISAISESDSDSRPKSKSSKNSRTARESVEVPSSTIQSEVLDESSRKGIHRSTPSEMAIITMDRDWEKKLNFEEENKQSSSMYTKPKRKNSFSMTPTKLESDFGIKEQMEREDAKAAQKARESVVLENNNATTGPNRRARDSKIVDQSDADEANKNGAGKHSRTPSEMAIDSLDPQWEHNLGFNGLAPVKESNKESDISKFPNPKLFSKPQRKNSLSIAKTTDTTEYNDLNEATLNELALTAEQENSDEETERNKADYESNTNDAKRRGSVKMENENQVDSRHQRNSTAGSTLSENNYFNQVD